METRQRIICRLCLKICNNFRVIGRDIKDALNILLPKFDLAAIQEPVMCSDCTEMVIICFDFKEMCLNTHNYLVPFDNKDGVKLNLIDAYLSRNKNCTGILENQDICGFCMNPAENYFAISLDIEERDIMLENMIEQCLPELDLSIITKPVICAPCRGSLECCYHFVTNFLIVEAKIKKYCATLDVNCKEIDLNGLLQLTTGNVDDNSDDIIKAEEQFCEERENDEERQIVNEGGEFKLEQMFCDSNAPVKKEAELESKMDIDCVKLNSGELCMPTNILTYKEESENLDVIKSEEKFCGKEEFKEERLVEMEDQKCLLNEEIEIKTDEHDFNRFEDDIFPRPDATTGSRKRRKRITSNLEKDLLKPYVKRTPTNESVEKTTAHRRNTGSLETNERYLESHLETNERYLESHLETNERYLESHLETNERYLENRSQWRQDSLEVTTYDCESCFFKTTSKIGLKIHSLVHKSSADVTMFDCDSCPFKTKSKSALNRHLMKHKSSAEITTYACNSCSYRTKFEFALKNHLLIHMDASEVTVYTCDSCPFQSKYKGGFIKHLLAHKNSLEARTYTCDACAYRTHSKEYLKSHLRKHSDASKVTMYACDSCSYRTKYKSAVKTHLLVHKNSSDATTYACDSCAYRTNYKHSLQNHLLKHKDPSEVTAYACGSCPYRSKYKGALKTHLLVHKDSSEVTVYTCDACSYRTYYKQHLKSHLLRHEDPLKVTMYACKSCSYRTKYGSALKKHSLRHDGLSDV